MTEPPLVEGQAFVAIVVHFRQIPDIHKAVPAFVNVIIIAFFHVRVFADHDLVLEALQFESGATQDLFRFFDRSARLLKDLGQADA